MNCNMTEKENLGERPVAAREGSCLSCSFVNVRTVATRAFDLGNNDDRRGFSLSGAEPVSQHSTGENPARKQSG